MFYFYNNDKLEQRNKKAKEERENKIFESIDLYVFFRKKQEKKQQKIRISATKNQPQQQYLPASSIIKLIISAASSVYTSLDRIDSYKKTRWRIFDAVSVVYR